MLHLDGGHGERGRGALNNTDERCNRNDGVGSGGRREAGSRDHSVASIVTSALGRLNMTRRA